MDAHGGLASCIACVAVAVVLEPPETTGITVSMPAPAGALELGDGRVLLDRPRPATGQEHGAESAGPDRGGDGSERLGPRGQ